MTLHTRKSESHWVTFVGNQSWKILYLSPLCQTLSKVFSTSRRDAITCSLPLKLSITVYDRRKRWLFVDLAFLKPDWRWISSLCRNHSLRISKYSLARRTISCHRILVNIGLVGLSNRDSQIKLKQSTLRLTEHANIFLNTRPVVVFSYLSLQLFLPCTRSQQRFTTATIRSFGHFEHLELPLSLYCDVAFTRCE